MSAYYENPTEPQERETLVQTLLAQAPEGSLYRKLDNLRTYALEQTEQNPRVRKKILTMIEDLALKHHAKQIPSEQGSFITSARLSELYTLWSSMDEDLVSQVRRLEQITQSPEFPFL